ncbi:phenylacetate--CoA ligase family protein [Candidatus Woesearchaeota archaeon]|jgi:phenylacetate-CoA ligase|nr:phenylacetate--CoA ligase family protein [Candidatus Woesearchaeota archaeon]MBT3537016.1 phenylacetate--CoA ligase family protein [Candidatus Woesearchaeota archaeon]MBT4697626.1 phenylacetate--CoA ligase family protein [Candidatus Woesearchaeota archaeon]MBT4716511.1 phenylacetate--CoA ligase family protein [Candidatus Woesearchaeota archaeon]MBT7106674.1 phenylacetate--CoA ligase family protein [Candidatus Woesearchaeota archaeon]
MLSKVVRYLPAAVLDSFMRRNAHNIDFLRSLILNSSPKDLDIMAKRKVVAAFKRAALNISHYENFLSSRNVIISDVADFDDFVKYVPMMTKNDYVKTSKGLSDLCVGMDVSKCSLLARSSGYSGKASTWAKSREEQKESKNFAALGLDLLFNITKEKTLLVDTFALGSWVSGVDLLMIADSKCSVIAPGADMEESLDIFKDMKDEYDQFIFAGTPHFTKNLFEEGVRKKINFKRYKINLLLGAEPFTEGWRQHMSTILGTSMRDDRKGFIFSAFGASDLGITGVNETKDSAYIRYLCMNDKKLRKAIYGTYASVLPTLFQYDPTKYFIETNKKDELIFTNCDLKAMMPLIRYNIHDVGGLLTNDKVNKILKEHGVSLKLELPTPFVFVVGRSDGTVNFIGQLIYPEYIHDVIFSNKQFLKQFSGVFRLQEVYDKNYNPFLQIDVQLKKKQRKSKALEKKAHAAVMRYFTKLSTDFPLNFSILQKKTGKSPLIINLYEFEKYPHKHGIKVKYV